MYSGGLKNDWVVSESEAFQKDWSEADMLASAKAGGIDIKSYVFLECFNRSPAAVVNSSSICMCARTYHCGYVAINVDAAGKGERRCGLTPNRLRVVQ